MGTKVLYIILGTLGCGKTAYVHRLLKKMVREGERDMLLLVPEQFTYESDLGVLEQLGAAGACEVEALSFERLARRILEKYPVPSLPQLDGSGKTVLMSLAVSELRDRLKVYARHSDTPAFISGMLELTDELKQCAVTPQMLSSASGRASGGLLSQKAAEAALIYETYDALTAQSFFDTADDLTRARDIIRDKRLFEGRVAVLDGFRRFTGQELSVVECIMAQAKDVYVTFCTDSLEISEGEAGAFTSIKMTARRLMDSARRCGVKISAPTVLSDEKAGFSTYFEKSLRHLEETLYMSDAVGFDGDGEAVTVCAAATITDECAYVARTIKQLMRSGFCRCRDISVIFRQEGVYERELKYALKKYGVAMFEDNRQPIANQPLVCFVRSALSVCADGFDTDTLMRLAKTSLSGLDVDEWSALENYALMWDIRGNEWLGDWGYNPDGFGVEMNERRRGELDIINSYRQRLVQPLEKLRSDCREASGKKISETLYRLLIDTGVDKSLLELAKQLDGDSESALASEQQQVWDILMHILDQMACALGDRTVPVKRYASLFELSISAQSLGHIPTGFDETYIGAATRIQRRMAQVVFVVGMNDGVFPLPASGGGIFTDAERLELERLQVEMAKNSRTHALDEMFIVYNSLCSARKRLYISYSCASATGARLNRSQTVDRVEKLVPGCTRVTAAAQSDMEYVEADEPAFELLARLWHDGTALSQSLRAYFAGREDYAGKLRALERAAEKKRFKLESGTAALELFGRDMRLSASRVDSFESCPFQYFCRYGLEARVRKTARLDPAQSGTVIHYVLEKILSEYGSRALPSLGREKIGELVRTYLGKYADEYMGGLSDKPKRFVFLFDRLARTLDVIVARLCLEFEKSLFEPCDFELKIGGDGSVRAYELSLPGGGSLSVYGVVDRVDKMERDGKTYIRIIDYKTGAKEFYLSDVLNGMNMQLLLYLIALWRGAKEYYGGELVPAGVLYLPARFMPFDADGMKTEAELHGRVMADGRMSGLILDDSAAVSGMAGDGGLFVPVKRSKDGSFKGNLIDLESLGRLKRRLDETLTALAGSLHSGDIAARPVQGRNYDRTCDFCDYGNVCCHEKDDEFRYIGFLKHEQCLEALSQEADDGETVD